MLAAFAIHPHIPIENIDVDDADAIQLAEALGLSSDDAVYLWLAQKLAAELLTLDRRLQTAGATLVSA